MITTDIHRIIPLVLIASVVCSCASGPAPNPIIPAGIGDLGFPAQISLAALGKQAPGAQGPQAGACPFTKGDPNKSQTDFNRLLAKLETEALDKSLPLDEQQRREAFALVKSGQFKRDIASSLKQVYTVNRELPLQAVAEIDKGPDLLVNLPQAFARDLAEHPVDIGSTTACVSEFTKRVQSGPANQIDAACRPQLLTNTLTVAYRNPTVASVAKTARIVTNKQNRSMRLALIAYARMNGINITERDLDALDTFLDTGRTPDLTPLVETGLQTFAEQYGLKDIQEAKNRIRNFDDACSLD